jgi:cupin fold WbuC family metalloprotein
MSVSGVTYLDGGTITFSRAELARVKADARGARRRRARLCTHGSPDAPVHEMLIALRRDSYVRPHRHPGKPESLLVVSGTADAVFFDEEGGIADVLAMGPPTSGRTFYYRIADPIFHTLLVRSPVLVFQEVTRGPFRADETELAPWAPAEDQGKEAARFADDLRRRARAFRRPKGARR